MMFRRNSARPLLPLALLLCGTFLGRSAVAQVLSAPSSSTSENPEITEIIVTARKLGENIQAIPESITAIDSRTLAAAHLTTLDDLNSQVTNLNITQRADNTPDVVLRGVGTYGVVQGVGFYVNDVQQFEGQSVRPMDIERIEVLKGPQGTLFGGSNVGGAIKYVTKDPTSTWENEATVELGSYSTRNYQAVFSGPLSDTVGVRASVYYDHHDGNIYDTVNKFDYGAATDRGARISVVAEPNDSNKIDLWLSADK